MTAFHDPFRVGLRFLGCAEWSPHESTKCHSSLTSSHPEEVMGSVHRAARPHSS